MIALAFTHALTLTPLHNRLFFHSIVIDHRAMRAKNNAHRHFQTTQEHSPLLFSLQQQQEQQKSAIAVNTTPTAHHQPVTYYYLYHLITAMSTRGVLGRQSNASGTSRN